MGRLLADQLTNVFLWSLFHKAGPELNEKRFLFLLTAADFLPVQYARLHVCVLCNLCMKYILVTRVWFMLFYQLVWSLVLGSFLSENAKTVF